jgi:hypothetical protein
LTPFALFYRVGVAASNRWHGTLCDWGCVVQAIEKADFESTASSSDAEKEPAAKAPIKPQLVSPECLLLLAELTYHGWMTRPLALLIRRLIDWLYAFCAGACAHGRRSDQRAPHAEEPHVLDEK